MFITGRGGSTAVGRKPVAKKGKDDDEDDDAKGSDDDFKVLFFVHHSGDLKSQLVWYSNVPKQFVH